MNRRGFLKALAALPAVALLPTVAGSSEPVFATATGLAVGDIFTISGVYAINPMTLESTGREKQFVVTAVSDAGMVVTMSPQPYTTGPYRNVTAIPAGARIRPMWSKDAQPRALYRRQCMGLPSWATG